MTNSPVDPLSASGAYVQTRADLGARCGEATDDRDWLRSLKARHDPGPCRTCSATTSRYRAVGEVMNIAGRNMASPSERECRRCQLVREVAVAERRQANPDLEPLLKGREAVLLGVLKEELAALVQVAA